MELPIITKDEVLERLAFGERRLIELLNLNDGDMAGADPYYRQQLLQELLFHVVGAIEVLAQLINHERKLDIDFESVNVSRIVNKLSDEDPIKLVLSSLSATTRKLPVPENPYSDEGYIFRLINYRNQVTHRGKNRFFHFMYLNSPKPEESHLMVDPREPNRGPSNQPARVELPIIFDLVNSRCKTILALL